MTAHLFSTEGTVEDYEEFLDKYEALLHPNHYHMLTAKLARYRNFLSLITSLPENTISTEIFGLELMPLIFKRADSRYIHKTGHDFTDTARHWSKSCKVRSLYKSIN